MVLRMKLLKKTKRFFHGEASFSNCPENFYYGIVDSSFVQTKKIKTAESINES
tara:strand:+ start:992 stop:1150 length:159 start_codon:yes stop_codon:yes gene_type:complete